MDFRFKLEALRQFRGFQEETRQKELAEAQRIRNQEEAILSGLIAARDKTEKEMQSKRDWRSLCGVIIVIHCKRNSELSIWTWTWKSWID